MSEECFILLIMILVILDSIKENCGKLSNYESNTVCENAKIEFLCSIKEESIYLLSHPLQYELHGFNGSKEEITRLGWVHHRHKDDYAVEYLPSNKGKPSFKLTMNIDKVKDDNLQSLQCVVYGKNWKVVSVDKIDVHRSIVDGHMKYFIKKPKASDDSKTSNKIVQIEVMESQEMSDSNNNVETILEIINEPPCITRHLKSVSSVEEEPAEFEARFIHMGYSPLKVRWFVCRTSSEDRALVSRDQYKTAEDWSKLSIKQVEKEDEGIYVFEVENENGIARSTAYLNVMERRSKRYASDERRSKRYASDVKFVLKTNPLKYDEPVEMICETGYTGEETWYIKKDDSVLFTDTALADGYSNEVYVAKILSLDCFKFTILKLTKTEEDIYYCAHDGLNSNHLNITVPNGVPVPKNHRQLLSFIIATTFLKGFFLSN